LAIGPGTSRLDLIESNENPWASNGSEITPIHVNDGSVQVVPIPAAVWFFASGIIGLLGMSMRKTIKASVERISHL
jgi:prophage antirepressor-like protein